MRDYKNAQGVPAQDVGGRRPPAGGALRARGARAAGPRPRRRRLPAAARRGPAPARGGPRGRAAAGLVDNDVVEPEAWEALLDELRAEAEAAAAGCGPADPRRARSAARHAAARIRAICRAPDAAASAGARRRRDPPRLHPRAARGDRRPPRLRPARRQRRLGQDGGDGRALRRGGARRRRAGRGDPRAHLHREGGGRAARAHPAPVHGARRARARARGRGRVGRDDPRLLRAASCAPPVRRRPGPALHRPRRAAPPAARERARGSAPSSAWAAARGAAALDLAGGLP